MRKSCKERQNRILIERFVNLLLNIKNTIDTKWFAKFGYESVFESRLYDSY